jgi:hypothetical protein
MVLSCDPEAAGGQAIKPSRYGPYLAGRAHLLKSEKLSELCDLDLVTLTTRHYVLVKSRSEWE